MDPQKAFEKKMYKILRQSRLVPGLTILKKIGEGGMSQVYKGLLAGREGQESVAVKVSQASLLPFLIGSEAEEAFPRDDGIPVHVDYFQEGITTNTFADGTAINTYRPASISILNESETERQGNYYVKEFQDPNSEKPDRLEYMLRIFVAGRECMRLLKEAELKRGTTVPLVVGFKEYQFFTALGHLQHALVMEYVPWPSLEQLLKRPKPLTDQQEYTIGYKLCSGLQLTEETGVIHNDFKPGNVAVNLDTGDIKLYDFDAGHSFGRFHPENDEDVGVLLNKTSLDIGRIMGTPPYTAPEIVEKFFCQVRGEIKDSEMIQITPKADVYSVGRIIAEMFRALNTPSNEYRHFAIHQDLDYILIRMKKNGYPADVIAATEQMLLYDPQKRDFRPGLEVFGKRAYRDIPTIDLSVQAAPLIQENYPLRTLREEQDSARASTITQAIVSSQRSTDKGTVLETKSTN